jgi:hypothetical protein
MQRLPVGAPSHLWKSRVRAPVGRCRRPGGRVSRTQTRVDITRWAEEYIRPRHQPPRRPRRRASRDPRAPLPGQRHRREQNGIAMKVVIIGGTGLIGSSSGTSSVSWATRPSGDVHPRLRADLHRKRRSPLARHPTERGHPGHRDRRRRHELNPATRPTSSPRSDCERGELGRVSGTRSYVRDLTDRGPGCTGGGGRG